jgi:hypothetical protein
VGPAHGELGGPCLSVSHHGASGTHLLAWGRYPRCFGLHPPGAQHYLVSIEATAAVAAGCSHARRGGLGKMFALHGVRVLKIGFSPCGSMGGFLRAWSVW